MIDTKCRADQEKKTQRQIAMSTKSRDILFDSTDNHLWIKSPLASTYHMGRVVNEI